MSDEELQHKIEDGEELHSSDAEAYRKVFSAVQREPEFMLSSSFEDLLLQRIAAQHARESYRDGWWLAGGLIFFLIGFVITLLLVDFKPDTSMFSFFTGYPRLVIFGVAFILVLNYIDRKFIRPLSLK